MDRVIKQKAPIEKERKLAQSRKRTEKRVYFTLRTQSFQMYSS